MRKVRKRWSGKKPHRKDQAALAIFSTRGKQIVAPKSGHHVPLDEPGIVGLCDPRDHPKSASLRNQSGLMGW